MPAQRPDIFQFTDFREYLRLRYAAEKTDSPRFSHRFVAEKVGASSTGWFSDILKGRITLTGVYSVKLAKLLELKPNEEDFFQTLVHYGQAGSLEEKNHYLEKILAFKELKIDLVGKDKFEYYSKWYHAAIRELLLFYPYRGDFADLARRLSPSIRPEQAKKAVQLLDRLNLIAVDPNGIYRPTAAILKKDAAIKSIHLENFLKANMELGVQALDRYPKEERDISSVTVSLEAEDFEKAREDIKALRKRLLALSEKPGTKKRVYQCNFQVFPLSREVEEK